MTSEILEKAESWISSHNGETLELLDALCRIPAPSGKEEKRAEFCKRWLENIGARGVFIDGALNVVFPYCDDGGELTAVLTHTDTVFPDLEPFDVVKDGNVWRCPGIGDNTVHVAQQLMTVKFILENGIKPEKGGMLFVCDSCEEGLGNLKGVKEIVMNYGKRLKCFIAVDGVYPNIAVRSVGSKRFRVEVRTEGGHSFGKFGNKNAIHLLSEIITELYKMQVPVIEGRKTTFNVGTISGGTSVNTIAQQAEMLFEFRSDDRKGLEIMEKQFNAILDGAKQRGVDLSCEIVGERPCSGEIDKDKMEELVARMTKTMKKYTDLPIHYRSGSTDCNIPSSVGIPSVCIGGYHGAGAHTREEYIDITSVETGSKIVADAILSCM